ncbi:MAG TPA: hypothetical protein VF518_02705, partial [Polyangia bacterium]
DWTGEGELDSDETTGTVQQAGPTVVEAPPMDKAKMARGMGMSRMAAPAPAMEAAKRMDAEPKMAKKPASMDDLASSSQPTEIAARSRSPRSGMWMRKVWTKEARVGTWQPRGWSSALALVEQSLRDSPDSRDRHRKVVQLLARDGDLERAQQMAERWLERDRLDAEALTALADLLARQGDREESLRWLSGIVDLEPDNKSLHERLARAYERLGATDRACAHRMVLAELSPSDYVSVGAALRCEQLTRGPSADEEFLSLLASDPVRRRAQGVARAFPPRTPTRGEVVLDAAWQFGDDLDIALISPQGVRISWMGGRKTVFADHVADLGQERLGLGSVSPGTYLVEISRTGASAMRPVRGRVRLTALGIRHDLPFTLSGSQTVAGTLIVERRSHLEPVGRGLR